MNVLITGGAGFIGSHLADRCLQQGWRVHLFDDLSTGSLRNLEHLNGLPGVRFTLGSVCDVPAVAQAMERCDLVYHLAAAVGVRLVVDSPVRTIETNVRGTEAVLEAAAMFRTPVVIASTSEVYGKSTALPFREDADLVFGPTSKGRWSYAGSKALDEFLGLAYWSERHLPVTIVRLFNTVGPRQTGRYGMVLPTFVRQALDGESITVFGSGEQRRCFGYVGDTVEALVGLAGAASAAGEVINIGNDREITINALAELVRQVAGSASPIAHVPYEAAYGPGFEDMFRRVPCVDKLERLTGFRPRTPLKKVIERVIAYERSQSRQKAACIQAAGG